MTASEDRPWSRRVAPDDGEADGRATPLSPGSQSEPLSYRTVQRAPGAEGQLRPRRSVGERRDEPDLPPTEALPTQDLPRYRSRDFSPEGRRAVPSWAPAAAGTPDAPSGERLDYHTLTRAEVRAAAQRYESDRSAEGSAPGEAPMSTPDQPLTRRQLRALREAQEAAERDGSASPDETAPDEDRPPARPWAPVFYGEPAGPDRRTDDSDASVDESAEAEVDEEAEAEAAEEMPFWSGSAPATFAIPVIVGEGDDSADPRIGASSDASPASGAPELVEPPADDPATRDAEDAAAAGSGTLDDWVAGLYGEQPSADARPADLVEPPEPRRWDDAPGREAPAVLEDLFSPPARDGGPEPAAPAPHAEAPRPVTDPLEFLDAAPSAGDRVDLPAPVDWAQPTVVGQPPVEPPGARADVEAIPVEAHEVSRSEATELHPVVIDAEPLPAEAVPDAPRADPVATPSGHWAAQAAEDSDADLVAGRDVGGGHGIVTTNALVLPSIPSPELSGPLTTGEIVVTGSIDLPRSLSSTGAHPAQLDQSSLDHELDPGDQQVVSVDSQPVRAIKAVSTHTSTRGMMTSTKPHGNRGLTVLIVVTGGLAVVTLGVLAFGLANNAF